MKRRRSPGAAERFADLDARLADPQATWREVVTLLACWPPEQDPAAALRRVEAVLHRWPPRTRDLPRFAVRQLLAGEVRPYLRLVRWLDLRALWQIRDRAALLRRLVDEAGLAELLGLTARYDDGEALIELLTGRITGLEHLEIGGSGIGEAGARGLAACPAMAGVQQLILPNNRLDDAAGAALLASPHLGGLSLLNLYGNCLSPAMIERIVAAPQWRATRIVIHAQRGA